MLSDDQGAWLCQCVDENGGRHSLWLMSTFECKHCHAQQKAELVDREMSFWHCNRCDELLVDPVKPCPQCAIDVVQPATVAGDETKAEVKAEAEAEAAEKKTKANGEVVESKFLQCPNPSCLQFMPIKSTACTSCGNSLSSQPKWHKQLQELMDLGCGDQKRNAELLEKHGGDATKAYSELIDVH